MYILSRAHFILSGILYTGVCLFTPSISYSISCQEFYKKKSQIETFKDVLTEYRSIVLKNTNLPSDKIPSIKFQEIKGVKFEKTDGKGNAGFAQRSLRQVFNEIKFALILYKLGLGPKFFGLTMIPHGSIGLVYEKKNGKPVQLFESYNVLTDKQWKRLKIIEIILNASGIRPRDFSFIADKNGNDLHIIDSEFYQIVQPYDPGISFSFHANRNGIEQILDLDNQ